MHIKDNKRYYSKGRLSFKTFADDRYLALAMVNDFSDRAETHWAGESEINICEFGIGYGDFALNFMNILKKKNKDLYKKTNYYMYDASRKLLSKAKSKLKQHKNKITAILSDLTKETQYPNINPHYIRFNELWDDLPAKIYTLKMGVIYDVQKNKRVCNMKNLLNAGIIREFLSNLPYGYHVVINDCAMRHLRWMNNSLSNGGYADIFDYGFMNIDLPPNIWNRSLMRKTDHITYDVNFILMQTYARSIGLKCYVEKQDEYVSNMFGVKLYSVELKQGLYYMTKEEMNHPDIRKYLLSHGYDENYLSGKFQEPNDYYHMRVWK